MYASQTNTIKMSAQRFLSSKDRVAMFARMKKLSAENATEMAMDPMTSASTYGVDSIILHVVTSGIEIEPTFNINLLKKAGATKFQKLNQPVKSKIPKMILAMDRAGEVVAVCLTEDGVFGEVAAHARKALQPGEGICRWRE